MLARLLQGRANRGVRRGVPIAAYVGANGSGKSLAMIHDTLPSLAAGRPVLSNVRLFDWEGSDPLAPHPLWIPLTSWRQLITAEGCDILLDEIQGVASARSYAALPAQLQTVLCQLRKRDCVLRWTSPNWQRADVIIREVTQAVTHCSGYLLSAMYDPVSGERLLWPSRKLFRWVTYSAVDYEDWSLSKAEGVKPLCQSFYWRSGNPAMTAYSTLGQIDSLDHLDDIGRCINCGGQRKPHKCGCKPDGDGELTGSPSVPARTVRLAPAGGAPAPTGGVGVSR